MSTLDTRCNVIASLCTKVADLGLNFSQFRFLLEVYQSRHDPRTQADIGDDLGLNRSSSNRVAFELSPEAAPGIKGAGLIERTDHPDDRRRKILVLTPKGERVLADILSILASLEK